MALFDTLGFAWNRSNVPVTVASSVERSIFRFEQSLPQFVFDASALEGNPLTFREVKTLLDGKTVDCHRLSDQQQVLNLAAAAKELLVRVQSDSFQTDKATFDHLHSLVAKEEALEWGHFRGEGEFTALTPRVALGDGVFVPSNPTESGSENLKRLFEDAIAALDAEVPDARERGMAFFLFGALQQFYFDGNKRTSRFMMNGILMSNGLDAISIPAARAREFDENMVRFYTGRNADEMMSFLIDCEPKDASLPAPNLG